VCVCVCVRERERVCVRVCVCVGGGGKYTPLGEVEPVLDLLAPNLPPLSVHTIVPAT